MPERPSASTVEPTRSRNATVRSEVSAPPAAWKRRTADSQWWTNSVARTDGTSSKSTSDAISEVWARTSSLAASASRRGEASRAKFVIAASAMLAKAAPATRAKCNVDSVPKISAAALKARNVATSSSKNTASSGPKSPSPAVRMTCCASSTEIPDRSAASRVGIRSRRRWTNAPARARKSARRHRGYQVVACRAPRGEVPERGEAIRGVGRVRVVQPELAPFAHVDVHAAAAIS